MISRMRPWALLAALALPLGLGACATGPGDSADPPLTPTEHYAIDVQSQPEELKLAAHASGVSRTQDEALSVFARRWADQQGGDVTIQSPSQGPDPAAAYRTATGARDALVAQGVEAGKVRIVGYDAAGDRKAPVIVGYLRYIAHGPVCGQVWGNLTNTFANRDTDNFGCATTANMAALIANPGDLATPRTEDTVDAGRRQTVLDHYRKGEVTSSAKDTQADGAISRAVP